MAAASWVMADPRRFAAAQRAGPGRAPAGRGGRIRSLPPPLSAWTGARDAARPAGQDLPAVVARLRPGSGMNAREEVLARVRTALGADPPVSNRILLRPVSPRPGPPTGPWAP